MKLCCTPLPWKQRLPSQQHERTISHPIDDGSDPLVHMSTYCSLPPGIMPLSPIQYRKQPRAPDNVRSRRLRRQLSSLAIHGSMNQSCMLLQRLPLELRLIIFSHVIGNDQFRIITIPWKLVAAPDIEGNVSMTRDHISSFFGRSPNQRRGFSSGNALLQTCRQIYQEAIDVLYATNTFVFLDFPTFETFAKTILPARLNAIRSLQFRYSPTKSIGYQHECTGHYDLPSELDSIWELVLSMKGLQHLDLELEAYSRVWKDDQERKSSEVRRLSPLLDLRGLSTFQLELVYLSGEDQRAEPYAPALRQAIFENVRQPRDPWAIES